MASELSQIFNVSEETINGNEMLSQAKQMMKSAKEAILAVDSSNFDRIAFFKLCGIEAVGMVVTDARHSDRWLTFLGRHHIGCI